MKISALIVGLIVVSAVVGVFGIFYATGSAQYGVTYDENMTAGYDKYAEINQLSSDLNQSINRVEQGSPSDIVGGLLGSGYTVLKTTFVSGDMFTDMATTASDQANLGSGSRMIFNAIILIVFVLIVFAFIAVLVGRESL